jgi:hypothetical protein
VVGALHSPGGLGQLLGRPGFGAGPATIGAELELCLVDDAVRPLLRNQAVRALAADPRVTLELNRFNLELNASPAPLAGRPFAALAAEFGQLLDRVGDAAREYGRAWQRAALAAAERGRSRDQALAVMLERYLACAGTGESVHTWPV